MFKTRLLGRWNRAVNGVIGGSSTDLIMLVMSERGSKLLESTFTLGAEGSVAAGPVGRTATAQTDAQLHADILSRSRSQGLFAGLALEVAHRALPSRRRGEKSRQTGRKLPGLLAAARPWGR